MEALAFFGLQRTRERWRWRMPVIPELCSGLGALFGGCGLGAGIEVLEQETGRPLVWATAQYLSFARPPSVLSLDATEIVRGHQISQARVVGHVEGEEIFTVNAALGRRDFGFSGSWAIEPRLPRPEVSPLRLVQERHLGTIMDRLDMRLANARNMEDFPAEPGDGRSALWVRLPSLDMSAAALAIVGDYVPFGIGQALGQRAGGQSLDNTLRVASRTPTEWILADVRVHAVADGFGHGLVHLWAEDGTLLGTASQSTIVRGWREPGDGAGAQRHGADQKQEAR
ncbi:MAG TPA: thioesterase family protein [Acidimicrobiia bacterium]